MAAMSPTRAATLQLLQLLQASNITPCNAAKALSARARSVTSSSPVPQAPSARLPQHHRIAPLLREGQGEDEVAARVWPGAVSH